MTLTRKLCLAALGLPVLLSVSGLAGCASRGADVQAPAGMKVGKPLTPAQVQAIQQKRAAQ